MKETEGQGYPTTQNHVPRSGCFLWTLSAGKSTRCGRVHIAVFVLQCGEASAQGGLGVAAGLVQPFRLRVQTHSRAPWTAQVCSMWMSGMHEREGKDTHTHTHTNVRRGSDIVFSEREAPRSGVLVDTALCSLSLSALSLTRATLLTGGGLHIHTK